LLELNHLARGSIRPIFSLCPQSNQDRQQQANMCTRKIQETAFICAQENAYAHKRRTMLMSAATIVDTYCANIVRIRC
jgi:hypothetical protein